MYVCMRVLVLRFFRLGEDMRNCCHTSGRMRMGHDALPEQQPSGSCCQAAFQFVRWPLTYFGCSLDENGKVALPMPAPAEG